MLEMLMGYGVLFGIPLLAVAVGVAFAAGGRGSANSSPTYNLHLARLKRRPSRKRILRAFALRASV